MNLCGCWLIVVDSIHPRVVPIAKAGFLTDRSSVIRGGGSHVEEVGNREGQANYGELLYDSLEGLTHPKRPLKHREIPSDLGEIPIDKYLLHLSPKLKGIPNDLREIPILIVILNLS